MRRDEVGIEGLVVARLIHRLRELTAECVGFGQHCLVGGRHGVLETPLQRGEQSIQVLAHGHRRDEPGLNAPIEAFIGRTRDLDDDEDHHEGGDCECGHQSDLVDDLHQIQFSTESSLTLSLKGLDDET